jgi:hypothetical protein
MPITTSSQDDVGDDQAQDALGAPVEKPRTLRTAT